MFSVLVIKTASQVVNYLQDLLCKFQTHFTVKHIRFLSEIHVQCTRHRKNKNNEVNNIKLIMIDVWWYIYGLSEIEVDK